MTEVISTQNLGTDLCHALAFVTLSPSFSVSLFNIDREPATNFEVRTKVPTCLLISVIFYLIGSHLALRWPLGDLLASFILWFQGVHKKPPFLSSNSKQSEMYH